MLSKLLPPLSTTARSLLAGEREQPEDEELKFRALQRAKAALDGERSSSVRVVPWNEGEPRYRRSRAARVALLAAALLAIAGIAAAGIYVARVHAPAPHGQTPEARPAVAGAAVQATSKPAQSAMLETEPAAPLSSARVLPAPSGRTSHRLGGAQEYALEVRLLEPARTDIARGDYNKALRAIAAHQQQYPNGQLAEEREALRVRALWAMGNQSAAQVAAAAFRNRYPRSALLTWMKAPSPQ